MEHDPKMLSDIELKQAFEEAKRDLEKAAQNEPESEWHQACFAGVMIYALEAAERGISFQTIH